MSQSIAELFVNIGIKGADKTVGALGDVKGKIGEITTSSLAAKAGILAVLYGLEQLAQGSMNAGQGLTLYNAATGMSIDKLQEWTHVARHAGMTAGEMEANITGLQDKMNAMQTAGTVPDGWGVFASATGLENATPEQIGNAEFMMEKAVEFAKKEKDNVAYANHVLEGLGLGKNFAAGARLGRFDQSERDKAPKYSDAQAAGLDRMKNRLGDVHERWEMAMGKMVAKDGPAIVAGVEEVSKAVLQMIAAFEKLGGLVGALKGISMVFEGWAHIFNGIGEVIDKVSDHAADLIADPKSTLSFSDTTAKGSGSYGDAALKKGWNGLVSGAAWAADKISPSDTKIEVNLTQHNNTHHSPDDIARRTGQAVSKAVGQALNKKTNKISQMSPANSRSQ